MRHVLSSLRPEKLKSSDFVDLSGGRKLQVYFGATDKPLRLSYEFATAAVPFPPNARGFLYYHVPAPPAPPMAGGIRLRIDSDSARGRDLLLPSGVPWQIGLPQLVRYAHCAGALATALKEALVAPAAVQQCTRVFGAQRVRAHGRMLFHVGQVFPLALDEKQLRLTVVGRARLAGARLFKRGLFTERGRALFRGSILVRFEFAPPDARDVLQLRVVKVVTPVERVAASVRIRGEILPPREGEFLSVRVSGRPTPWSYRVDEGNTSQAAAALRLLLEE
ncbi:hypothetical protein B0H10DRAFT_375876 [Mycena sp. CBHHK59/15]|nr:hypothetical protein B0H10DRAFT_375876 [Mycena sp. CBHHK59/15]